MRNHVSDPNKPGKNMDFLIISNFSYDIINGVHVRYDSWSTIRHYILDIFEKYFKHRFFTIKKLYRHFH